MFNYVLRLSGLEANRSGRTIFVGTNLPNSTRDTVMRSLRLNQVNVGVALNFLVGLGAESAISRERLVTSVNAVPVGGGADSAITQTQTTTEVQIETQRVDYEDSKPLLRGLQVLGDERTNSVTLIGTPKQIEMAMSQLIQLDVRRRQVAVNVKILDVNLLGTKDFNSSFSFGIANNFFSVDGGRATANFGGSRPPTSGEVANSVTGAPVIQNPIEGDNINLGDGFFNPQNGNRPSGDAPIGNPIQPGITDFTQGQTETEIVPTQINPLTGEATRFGTQATRTPDEYTFGLPSFYFTNSSYQR